MPILVIKTMITIDINNSDNGRKIKMIIVTDRTMLIIALTTMKIILIMVNHQ